MMQPDKDALDVGILVGDIKASLHFYGDLLGLELVEKSPRWFGTLYRMRFGKSDVKLIDPLKALPKGPVGLEEQLGFRYITFVIKNLSEFCTVLKNQGVEFVLTEREIHPGSHIAMVQDPDGNIVEFVERS